MHQAAEAFNRGNITLSMPYIHYVRLSWFLCIITLVISCASSNAQKFHLELGVAAGGVIAPVEDHSQGKAHFSITPKIYLQDDLSMGLEYITGGNLFPVDGLYLEREEGFRLLNPSSSRFQSLAFNPEWAFYRKGPTQFFAAASVGASWLSFRIHDLEEGRKPGGSAQLMSGLALGLSYNSARLTFSYVHLGHTESFTGRTVDNDLILLDRHPVRLFVVKASYNWDGRFK